MPEQILELAKRLDNLRDQLDEIRAKTRSRKRKLELLRLRKKVSREIRRLISINVRSNTQAYRNATAELKKANRDMRKVINDLQKYAEAISTAAQAIDLVVKIAA